MQTSGNADKKVKKNTDSRRNVQRSESEKGTYRTDFAGRTGRYNRENVDDNTTRLSAAGRNAATANLEALERAEQMETDGGSVGEIYRETGWFRGADGQWRFEIDDSSMRYYKGGDANFRKMPPGYVRHQELTSKLFDMTITEEEYQELRNSIWHNEYGRITKQMENTEIWLSWSKNEPKLLQNAPGDDTRRKAVRFDKK